MKTIITMYFAGKVNKGGGYRGSLLLDSDDRVMSYLHKEYELENYFIKYGGPIALACDHGCSHREGNHGVAKGCYSGMYDEYPNFYDSEDYSPEVNISIDTEQKAAQFQDKTLQRCYRQIKHCDVFYARIDTLDCYGTLMEIGIAYTFKKPIIISIYPTIDHENFWFIKQTTDLIEYSETPTLNLLKKIYT